MLFYAVLAFVLVRATLLCVFTHAVASPAI